MQNRLGVAPGVVAVPARLEPRANVGVVVDLAVVGEGYGSARIGHRLRRRGRQIDDCEPSVAEHRAAIRRLPQTEPVGTAVRHAIAHARDDFGRRAFREWMIAADDAAHDYLVPFTLAGRARRFGAG